MLKADLGNDAISSTINHRNIEKQKVKKKAWERRKQRKGINADLGNNAISSTINHKNIEKQKMKKKKSLKKGHEIRMGR